MNPVSAKRVGQAAKLFDLAHFRISRGGLLLVFLILLPGLRFTYAASEYTWIAQCDTEIGATVPAFSCTDPKISTEAPKVMVGADKCEKPEILNTRCVHKSRVGRIVTPDTIKNDVDIIFSCRKNMKGGLHQNDAGDKFWDIAVIQHSRKNGKTCFYQHLDTVADADDAAGAPASNSPEALKFWDFRVNFCTECHTNGPFIRSPHYWLDVKDSSGKRMLPSEGKINDDTYTVIHPNPPVANVDIDSGSECTNCHNIGAYFKKHKWRIGELNKIAAGIEKSLSGGPSPTKTGFHDFMADEASPSDPKAELQKLIDCLKGQTKETIDKSKLPKGCTLTKIYPKP